MLSNHKINFIIVLLSHSFDILHKKIAQIAFVESFSITTTDLTSKCYSMCDYYRILLYTNHIAT